MMLTRRRSCAFVFVLAVLVAVAAGCDEDEGLIAPGDFPDVSGFWSGQYSVTGCTLSGASDPFFCADVFFTGASLIVEMDLDQAGPDVFGVIAQGKFLGDVEGVVNEDGVLWLDGVIGGIDEDVTTTILAWQTGLVYDSLLGSWRFLVEDNTGSGFGFATVDASLKLFGPSVLKFWGCAVEGTLTVDGSVGGSLAPGDCQLDDASYFDVYALTGSTGDSLEISLSSTSFDAYLLIRDVNEDSLGVDDDSGGGPGGTDAALTLVFEVDATVLVVANSFTPGESGPYVLSATRLGPPPLAAAASERATSRALVRVVQGGSMKLEPAASAYRAPLGWKFSGLAGRKVKR
ncbi:MAG: hypothetical protein AMS25_10055 [Gemmatimonas sp. SM23_52]|nr:MAG: hypothetical protein AMS25_10055 [Gemmatimonas sp. SM23_52]